MMLEALGSITTQQSVNAPPLSNTGWKLMPRFVVFHRPPNALATYQMLEFFGSMAMSATRPVTRPGPMDRTEIPFTTSALSELCARAVDVNDKAATTAVAHSTIRFIQ